MTGTLSESVKKKIDKAVKKYPEGQQRAAIKAALYAIQEEKSWISPEDMKLIASYLSMSPTQVFEVATFYTLFELEPVGKHIFQVCTNVSCMLRGSDTIAEHLKNKLGIDFGQTTPDGKFTLKEVECLAACSRAPVLQLGSSYCEDLTCEKVDQLLESLE